jgi:hypothetical protein
MANTKPKSLGGTVYDCYTRARINSSDSWIGEVVPFDTRIGHSDFTEALRSHRAIIDGTHSSWSPRECHRQPATSTFDAEAASAKRSFFGARCLAPLWQFHRGNWLLKLYLEIIPI